MDHKIVEKLKELRFFDQDDDLIYPKQKLILGVEESEIEKQRENYEFTMKSIELNELED